MKRLVAIVIMGSVIGSAVGLIITLAIASFIDIEPLWAGLASFLISYPFAMFGIVISVGMDKEL